MNSFFGLRPQAPGATRPRRLASRHKARRPVGLASPSARFFVSQLRGRCRINALVTVEQAPTAGPHGEGDTVFSPRRQAESPVPPTVRQCPARGEGGAGFGSNRLQPAAGLSGAAQGVGCGAARGAGPRQVGARQPGDGGVGEAVFYHGEEVARRRRYSDLLLLAHS